MRKKNRSKWLSSFCHKPDQVNWRSSKICQHFIQTRKYTLINMVELDFMIWVLIATYKTCKSKFAVTLCKCVPCQHMSSLRLSLFYEHILFSSKKKKWKKHDDEVFASKFEQIVENWKTGEHIGENCRICCP